MKERGSALRIMSPGLQLSPDICCWLWTDNFFCLPFSFRICELGDLDLMTSMHGVRVNLFKRIPATYLEKSYLPLAFVNKLLFEQGNVICLYIVCVYFISEGGVHWVVEKLNISTVWPITVKVCLSFLFPNTIRLSQLEALVCFFMLYKI